MTSWPTILSATYLAASFYKAFYKTSVENNSVNLLSVTCSGSSQLSPCFIHSSSLVKIDSRSIEKMSSMGGIQPHLFEHIWASFLACSFLEDSSTVLASLTTAVLSM